MSGGCSAALHHKGGRWGGPVNIMASLKGPQRDHNFHTYHVRSNRKVVSNCVCAPVVLLGCGGKGRSLTRI